MKIFISQPMRNKSREEILNSRAAAKRILENYYAAPIEIIDSFIEDSEDKTPVYLLGQAISKMADADLVLLFDDIFEYSGCRIEYEVAIEYKIPTVFLSAIQDGAVV